MSPERTKATRALLLLFALAILLPLPLLIQDGWPRTHERFAALERIEGFRRAFAAGIWYPIWTPFAGWGWGSPWPLFYHRLYPSLGALLSFATGSVLLSFKLLLVLLLFATGAGMRRLLRVVDVSEVVATGAGIVLMASPYVLTDWLVRNAMAELTAVAVLPWLYAELALLAQGKARWMPAGVGVALLFHAHSLICYFFLLSLVLFVALHLKALLQLARTTWPAFAGAIALVMLAVLPQVLVASDLLKYFNVEVLTGPKWRVEANYHPLSHTFLDPFDWTTWQGEFLSVELNRYIWLGLALAASAFLVSGHARPRAPLFIFFSLWGTCCLLLQIPDFAFVFHLLPKADFVQFPWRLLSFLSIATVFVLAVLLDDAIKSDGWLPRFSWITGLGVATLTLVQFGTVPLRRHDVERFTSEKLASKVARLDGPNSFGEYLLTGMGNERPLPPPKQPIIRASCSEELHVPEEFSAAGLTLTANLAAPCEVAIRQFQTPLLGIELQNGELLSQAPADEILVRLEAGPSSVRVRPKQFAELLFERLHRVGNQLAF